MPNKEPTSLINKPSLIVLLFAACFAFWLVDFWKPINVYNKESVFSNNDVYEHYSYLPIVLLNQHTFLYNNKSNTFPFKNQATLKLPKYNYGLSILYLPAFLISLFETRDIHTKNEGFTFTFAYNIHYSAIVYVLLGLFFLRKFLLHFFSEKITAITLFVCLFGNNLFFFTFSLSELPQSHLFFLFAVFLFQTLKWHQNPNLQSSIILGCTIAIISLINAFELYIVLFFIFWGITNKNEAQQKFIFLKTQQKTFGVFAIVVLLFWIPQLLFNLKFAINVFSHAEAEKIYDFTDAKIYYFLLSEHRGWITYSPLILISFFGIYYIDSKIPISKTLFVSVLFLVLIVYSSRIDFNNNYFGAKMACTCVAWLSLPFGLFMDKIFKLNSLLLRNYFIKLILLVVIFSGVCLNLIQTIETIYK